jgi:hypothetical protein
MKNAIVFLVLFVATIGYAVAQTGNVAGVTQTGCNQVANIGQYGDYNEAFVEQTTFFDATNEAMIYQGGDYNEGKIEQVHTGSFFSAPQRVELDQFGDENKSESFQEGFEQFAYITQNSSLGDVKTRQEGFENVVDVDQWSISEKVDATQLGSYHYARLYQDGSNSEIKTLQEGDHNTVYVEQWYEDKADVTQDGSYNYANVDQYWAGYSEADVTQNGYSNMTRLVQENEGNKAEIYQEGMWNAIRLNQNGDGVADMFQDGMMNIVKGIGPEMWVNNLNGSELTTTQVGDFNVIEVYQATGEKATVEQYGCNNSAVVDQH